MNTIGLFGMLAGSAVALALFLSSFFLGIKRKEDPQNLWLGLILLAIALRIGKSIFYFLLNDMAPFGLAFGFLGLASIGPLTWLMIRHSSGFHWKNSWHFIVPVAGAIACYIVSPSPWETYLYISATAVLSVYLIFSSIQLMKSENEGSKNWNSKVLIMVAGVWAALVYQHLAYSMMDYAWGAIIAAVFLYWIFFQSFKTGIFPKGISVTLPDQTINQVRDAFENQQLFKEQGMNLQQFSARLEVPSYLVTRSVKQLYDRSFPETLNHFRVEEVKQMLLDPKKEHLKIESLAYDVGFASPSAFYAAFKKCTGQTPTAYQKEASLLSA
ncbi:helix-turn-helix domain-containing protein [Ekhidna sp.]|uniref:helix-turn-helix domain-containing protein n=1 Tax=Ekhidna sp. TaxID=2608089 RepID=UPI003C7DCE28